MKKIILALLGAITLLCFISCGTKPKDEEAVTPGAPNSLVDDSNISNLLDEEIKESSTDQEAKKNADNLYNQILELKKKIDDEGLASYDQKAYDAGVAALKELEALRDDKSSKGFDQEAKAKESRGKFITVINAAYKKFAKAERDEAYKAKKNADSVKAGVAEKKRYQQAAKDFQDGDSLYAMQAPEKAYNKYVSAKTVFTELYEIVYEKRAAAAAAIEAAKRKVSESENYAKQADINSPIREDSVEGIENENTKLLEDDNFEDPTAAEVDIPENIE